MVYGRHRSNAVCSTVFILTTLNYFATSTKIVYSFPSSGSGSGGGSAKSSSSSSQFVGAVKKREDLPGFDSEESFGPVKGYSNPGGSSGDGGPGGPAYSVSSFSTGGDVSGFSTHIKHDVPRRGDTQRSSSSEPEFYYPAPAEKPEPSRLFKNFFSQDEPSASPLSADFREASGSSNDEKHLEEIRKHMEEAERSAGMDEDGQSAVGSAGGGRGRGPSGVGEPSGFNEDGPGPGQNRDSEDDEVGCSNCNYAQFQMEH